MSQRSPPLNSNHLDVSQPALLHAVGLLLQQCRSTGWEQSWAEETPFMGPTGTNEGPVLLSTPLGWILFLHLGFEARSALEIMR